MHLIDAFAERAKRYMGALDVEPVYPKADKTDQLSAFETTLQEEPVDAKQVLEMLDEIGSPATVKSTGGRYYGFVTGGSLPAALSAKLLATVWDQNGALPVMSPVSTKLEEVAGKWLINLLDLPAETGYGFVSGDTMANFTGLAAARHALLKKAGWNVESKGLFHAPEITVNVGEEVHVSLLKALSMLGFGRDRVIRVPADAQGRMVADKISVDDENLTIICTQAGNVNTGSFDPTDEICKKYGNENVWVHVDAAFGLWAKTSGEKKYLAQGIELADSIATDAHKWLTYPMIAGLFLFVIKKRCLLLCLQTLLICQQAMCGNLINMFRKCRDRQERFRCGLH